MSARLHYPYALTAASGSTVIAHGLPQAPDRLWFHAAAGGVTVTFDATNITVSNAGDASVSVVLWAEVLHSTVRSLGGVSAGDPPLEGQAFVFDCSRAPEGVRTVATDTELDAVDELVVVTGASGHVTITLPASAGAKRVTVKDGDGSSEAKGITIAPQSGETIDGQSSVLVMTDYAAVTMVPDGDSAWWIV